jgi:hypothetical protein
MKAYKLGDEIINIGEWNFDIKTESAVDAEGNEIEVEIIRNPLPKGAIEVEVEVVETQYGRFAKDSSQHILAQIKTLETSITPRRMREAIIGDSGWLASVEREIKLLRDKINA